MENGISAEVILHVSSNFNKVVKSSIFGTYDDKSRIVANRFTLRSKLSVVSSIIEIESNFP